jgi:hypothetical protein
MQGDEFQRAVDLLLSWSNIAYVETIQETLRADPYHLVYHRSSVAYKVRSLIWADGRGIYVEEDGVAMLILSEALLRIPNTAAA